jgi:hypothetical protein
MTLLEKIEDGNLLRLLASVGGRVDLVPGWAVKGLSFDDDGLRGQPE